MGDRTVRLVLSGSSASALRALEEVSLKAEAAGKRTAAAFGDRLAGPLTQSGNAFQKLGASLGNWGIPFSSSLTKTGEKIAEADTKGKSLMSTLAGVGKMAVVGGAAGFAVIGAESVKMAGNFQQSMSKLVTSGGEMAANLKPDMAGVEKLMGQTGTAAAQLSAGLYTINSAGFHGAEGLKVLQAAAEGAKTENADVAVVTDGLTTLLNDYHMKASDAALVTSKMVAATSLGKTTFQDLAGSLHSVAPAAHAVGISMNEVLGAMATMTAKGTPAADAATYLRQTILQLSNPTKKARDEMAALGLSSIDVSQNLGTRGLTGTLELLTNAIQSKMGPAGTVLIDNLKQAAAAGSTWAQKLQEMTPAQQAEIKSLADMGVKVDQAKQALAGSTGQTVSATAAAKALAAAQGSLASANTHLANVQASLAGKTKLTSTEQLRLSDAMSRVDQASQKVTAAQAKQAEATGSSATSLAASKQLIADYQAKLNGMPASFRAVLNGLIANKLGFTDLQSTIAKLPPSQQTVVGALATMVGGTKSMQAALQLTGDSAATFNEDVKKVGAATTEAGGHVAGWATVQKNFNQRLAEAKGTVEALGIKLGMVLIPVVERVAQVTSQVVNWFEKHKAVAIAVAAVVGGVLVAAVLAYAVAMAQAAIATIAATWPILLIIAAVAAVIAAIVLLATHWSEVWGTIKSVVGDAWHFIDSTFIQPIEGFFSSIVGFIKAHWDLLLAILLGPIAVAADLIGRHIDGIIEFFSGAVNTIGGVFSSIGDAIVGAFKTAFDFVARLWNGTVGSLSFHIPSWVPGIGGDGFSMPKMPILDAGGLVSSPTVAMLSKNSVPEIVSPVPQLRAVIADALGGSGGGQPVQLVLDGRVIGQMLWPHVRGAGLRGTARNAVKVGLA